MSELAALGLKPRLRIEAAFAELEDARNNEAERVKRGLLAGWPLLNRPNTRSPFGSHSVELSLPSGKVTDRQAEVLGAISLLTEQFGIPPTIREIGNAVGIGSTNGVNDHLLALERVGAIARFEMMARGIRITNVGRSILAATQRGTP